MTISIMITFLVVGVIFISFGVSITNLAMRQTDLTKRENYNTFSGFCKFIGFLSVVVAIATPIIFPQYKVWQQNKEGEAELARAEQNRKIAVLEAKAKEESANSLAKAEIIRAQGVAQANKTACKTTTHISIICGLKRLKNRRMM